jgi:hypothetical protein
MINDEIDMNTKPDQVPVAVENSSYIVECITPFAATSNLTLHLDLYNHYWSTTHTYVEQFSHHHACVPGPPEFTSLAELYTLHFSCENIKPLPFNYSF